jgi:hypothetical protein
MSRIVEVSVDLSSLAAGIAAYERALVQVREAWAALDQPVRDAIGEHMLTMHTREPESP